MCFAHSRRFNQSPTSLGLDLPVANGSDVDGDLEKNLTGMSTKYLVDMQRFLACRKVSEQEHLVETSLGPQLKQVVGLSKIFSARSNLMFRSNTSLRTDGLKHHLIVFQLNFQYLNCVTSFLLSS